MSYQIEAGYREGHSYLRLRDIGSGSVRLAWEYPAAVAPAAEDSELARALAAEEAIQSLFKRLFLLTTEQYLSEREHAGQAPTKPDE
jgi:hypothetical protein